jgi:HD-GYP domain-containing protein (c-di-GMP phosphodiesterase class II)
VSWAAELKRHPDLGFGILKPITLWTEILPIVRFHHERWDGSGYPAGLKGAEIPLGARVVAVANVFDALMRPSQPNGALPHDEALAELGRRADSQLEPRLVRLFVAEYKKLGSAAQES